VPNAQYWDILFDLQKRVKLALEAGGISIPFPQHVVTMRSGSAAQ
jgi:small-conductance mechanosensitive channel